MGAVVIRPGRGLIGVDVILTAALFGLLYAVLSAGAHHAHALRDAALASIVPVLLSVWHTVGRLGSAVTIGPELVTVRTRGQTSTCRRAAVAGAAHVTRPGGEGDDYFLFVLDREGRTLLRIDGAACGFRFLDVAGALGIPPDRYWSLRWADFEQARPVPG